MGTLLFLFGGAAIGGFFVKRDTEQTLIERGVKVPGTVLERKEYRNREPDEPDTVSHGLLVEFQGPVQLETREFAVTWKAYDHNDRGSRVDVIYDPVKPSVAMLGGDLNDQTSTTFLVVGIVVLCVSFGLYGWAYKLAKDERDEAPDLEEALASAKKGSGRVTR
jgi:hypothetical protein